MNRKRLRTLYTALAALCFGGWISGALAQQETDTGTDTNTDQMVDQTLQQRAMGGGYGMGYGPAQGACGGYPCPYGGMGMMGPGMMGQGMMGPGMMGGGPGMGYGYPGMMGPGMMGGGPGMGYGYPGMMGPGMMGPGMMGGGPGMGYGYPGMMGPRRGMMGPMMSEFAMLDLSPDQQSKIGQIQQETLQKNIGLRQQVRNEQLQLRQLLLQERPDPKTVGEAYSKIAQLQRRLIESRVEAHNRMEALLTPEQRQLLQQNRRMMQRYYGPGQGAPGQGTTEPVTPSQ